jgi:hypothetical protein
MDDAGRTLAPSNPRAFQSTAGLLIVYSISTHETAVVHHVSVGVAGDVTAGAVGLTFVVWLAMLVGLPVDRVVVQVGKSTVYHGEVRFTPEEHDRLANASVLVVAPAGLMALRRACLAARSQLRTCAPVTDMS